MKNVKRLAAILAAAVLCMGMGTSALAAGGSNDELWSPEVLKEASGAQLQSVRDANGAQVEYEKRDLSNKTMQALSDENKVMEIFKAAGFDVTGNMDFIPLYAGGITWTGGGSAVVAFSVGSGSVGSESLQQGDAVYALRETSSGSGVFEAYAGEVDATGQVRFTLPGYSSLVLVKILSDGSIVNLNQNTEPTPEEPTPGEPIPVKVDPDVEADNADTGVTMEKANGIAKDANGNEIDIKVEVKVSKLEQLIEDSLTATDNNGRTGYENIFMADNPTVPFTNIDLVYKGDFDLYEVESQLKTNGSATVYFSMEAKEPVAGTVIHYYAIHIKEYDSSTGQPLDWEILPCERDADGQMYFTLDSFSPVAIIRVMSDQTPVLRPTKPSRPASGGSSSSTKKPGSTTQQEVTTQLGAAGQSGTTVQIGSSENGVRGRCRDAAAAGASFASALFVHLICHIR